MSPTGVHILVRIVEAGIEAFAQEGAAASTLEIARKAGVAESTIFRRFQTKDNFFQECFRTATSRSLDPVRFRALLHPETRAGKHEFSQTVQAALREWYLNMLTTDARLVLFTSLSRSRQWYALGAKRVTQIAAILAERIAQERHRRRTQGADAKMAAANIITNLLYRRSISTSSQKRDEQIVESCIRQWMFGLFPAMTEMPYHQASEQHGG